MPNRLPRVWGFPSNRQVDESSGLAQIPLRRSVVTSFFVNGKPVKGDDDPATPLLWVLRDSLGLTGTKFGCGMALGGACSVHLSGQAMRSYVGSLSRCGA